MRDGLSDIVQQGDGLAWISLERVSRAGTRSSFKISSFSQPEERRIQTAYYISSLIDVLYPNPTASQRDIKAKFTSYLNGTVEREGKEKQPGDIGAEKLLDYLRDLHLARLEDEAVEAGKKPDSLPFSEDQPEKFGDLRFLFEAGKKPSALPFSEDQSKEISLFIYAFLQRKGVVINNSDCIGKGKFGVVTSASVKGEEGKYVYKEEKRDVSKALTTRNASFWRVGDCAAARIHDLSQVTKPLFFIFRVCHEDQPEEFHYVPANHVKAFGMRLPPGTTVFLEGHLMERAVGENLDKILLKNSTILSPITGKHFTNIVRGLFNIIQQLQAHNLVHRDIKPENIFYNQDTGEVTLLDFGSATKLRKKEQADDGSHLHQPTSTEIGGTPKYISPRVLQQKEYGSEVDLFSFAMTVLQLVNRDEFEQFAHQRFPDSAQGGMRDALLTIAPSSEYLDRFLEAVKDKSPLPQSRSVPTKSTSFITSLLSWSGSNDAAPPNSKARAQSFDAQVSQGESKIERALNRNPEIKKVIQLAFEASGGGPEGAAAYETLRGLAYLQQKKTSAITDSLATNIDSSLAGNG